MIPSPVERRRTRGFTPICPERGCGSTRVGYVGERWLRCDDCGFEGTSNKFDQTVVPSAHANRGWRDGAALSMDGIDG